MQLRPAQAAGGTASTACLSLPAASANRHRHAVAEWSSNGIERRDQPCPKALGGLLMGTIVNAAVVLLVSCVLVPMTMILLVVMVVLVRVA